MIESWKYEIFFAHRATIPPRTYAVTNYQWPRAFNGEPGHFGGKAPRSLVNHPIGGGGETSVVSVLVTLTVGLSISSPLFFLYAYAAIGANCALHGRRLTQDEDKIDLPPVYSSRQKLYVILVTDAKSGCYKMPRNKLKFTLTIFSLQII